MTADVTSDQPPAPYRSHGDGVLVARWSDGHVRFLRGATAAVWLWSTGLIDDAEFESRLDVLSGDGDGDGDRSRAVNQIVAALREEGVLAANG